MSLYEVLRMAVHNLWRRKTRTVLNLLGVVVGGIVLLMTAAGGGGVRQAILGLFDSSQFARQVEIVPGGVSDLLPPESVLEVTAEMSEVRRVRIQEALKKQWQREQASEDGHCISPEVIADLEQRPHVLEIVPSTWIRGQATIGPTSIPVVAFGIGVLDPGLPPRIVAGQPLGKDDVVGTLIHEFLAYRLGFQSDQQLQQLVGMPIELAYRQSGDLSFLLQPVSPETEFSDQTRFVAAVMQLIGQLDATNLSDPQKTIIREAFQKFFVGKSSDDQPATAGNQPPGGIAGSPEPARRPLVVRGIFRSTDYNAEFSLFRIYFGGGGGELALPHQVADEIFLSDPRQKHFYNATVVVDSTRNLAAVVQAAESRGCETYSALPILESVDREITRVSWIFYALAGVILLVAAIGISNTLVISVLERTPELGIMKSLGARDSQVMLLMLSEGALLGAAGAATAVSISKLLALLGQQLLQQYVEGRIHAELSGQLFQFRLPVVLLVGGICITLCMAASVMPAWRAARLDPVIAMRRR